MVKTEVGLKVPFVSLSAVHKQIEDPFINKVRQLMQKGDFIGGEEVRLFESAYAAFNGTQYAIGVNCGLDALKVALRAVGVGAGDEVIVPANTFIATWLAVTELQAIPVPVDAEPLSGSLDVALLEAAITPKTKAIVPVHLYGLPCKMDEVMAIAEKHQLWVVEDNAQAQGAIYKGTITGSIGHINATSFYPSKNLGAAGDAGAITTSNPDLHTRAQLLKNYGSKEKYVHEVSGYNTRLDTIQAMLLNLKLPLMNAWNHERRELAQQYNHKLRHIEWLTLPYEPDWATPVYHLYTVRTIHRDALRAHLAERGVDTGIHYPVPVHLQQAYNSLGYRPGSFPVTEEISATTLSLPMYQGLMPEQVDWVCKAIEKFNPL